MSGLQSIGVAVVLALVPTGAGRAAAADAPAAAASDARAVEIADRVMAKMGGRERWDAVQCIGWTIFGRTHVWNKWTGGYRLEADSLLVIMNVDSGKGRAWKNGTEVTEATALAPLLDRARSIWINDSYWFLMPWKLEDDGVTLKYGGETTTGDGRPADMLVLTFDNVGDTPQNKYDVYVDRESGLVTQWSYYATAADPTPKFTLPWTGWAEFGGVMLAPGRGRTDVTGIRVTASDMPAAFRGP
jgi:hypothetical protein